MDIFERQMLAVRLRLSGMSFREVAGQLPCWGHQCNGPETTVSASRAYQITMQGYRKLKHPSRRNSPEWPLAIEFAKKFFPNDHPAQETTNVR